VTSALGSRRPWRARSALPVSPVRRPMLQANAEFVERRLQRAGGIGRQRAHGGDPQQAEWSRLG